MLEIIVPLLQAIGVLVAALAFLFSAPRIAMAAASYLAIKHNDRDMAMALVRQSSKVADDSPTLKDALKLLSKGKPDE